MASPTGTPVAPQPPIPPYRRRSMAGPVILILLGVVFLLANSHVLSWFNVTYEFGRWWPVLIILWGVIKLIEYYRAQEGGYRMRGIGVGGIFLLFWVVVLGLAAKEGTTRDWNGFVNDMNLDFDVGGQGYDYTDELQPQPVKAGGSVSVSSDRGDITISTWDQPQIKVVAHKHVTAGGQDEANKMADATKPQISGTPESLSVDANTGGSGSRAGIMGPHGVTTNLEVFLPRNVSVDLNTHHGDVKVHTREGSVRVSTPHGDVDLQDVTGNGQVTMHHGDLRAENVTGAFDLDGSLSDLDLNNIGGPVRITAEVLGSIKLTALKKGVQFHSSRTDMQMEALRGELNMDRGDLRVAQCDGFQVTTRSKDIFLDDVSGDVRVSNTNGQVGVHVGQLPLGNIRVDNLRGDVEVVVPANANFDVNASSRRGEVRSDDFPAIRVEASRGLTSATGTVGKGGAHVEVTSDVGNVQIRKAG